MTKIIEGIFFTALGIFGIGFVIGFHELGHFLFCKAFGIHTPTFSIGFGRRLFTKKIGETEFSISAIPFGGYVEHIPSEQTPYYQKLLVMLGGISFNVIFSYFTLIALFMVGMPKTTILYPLNASPTIATVAEGSAADHSQLKVDDTIIAINGQSIGSSVEKLFELLRPLAHQEVTLEIEREGKQKKVHTLLDSRVIAGKEIGTLGVTFKLIQLPGYSFSQAFFKGVQLTHRIILNSLHAFKNLFVSRDTSNLAGPLMVIAMTIQGAAQGLKIFLLFLAMISLSLAVLNIIPIPPLDGGKVLFITIEAIIRRPIPDRIQEYIYLVCLLAFGILFVFMTGKDLSRFASLYLERILTFLHLK